MAVLSRDSSLVSAEDLMCAIPEKEDPKETIGMISSCLGAGDPARAMEWAKTLETSAQRSQAVVDIAKSAARENRPETWDLVGRLKMPENRANAAKLWGDKAWISDVNGAMQKLTGIPDSTLVSPAAKGMLDKAYMSGFSQALDLAEMMQSSGVLPDSMEHLVLQTRVPPQAWKEGGKDERLLMIKNLTPQQKEDLYAAAAKLSKGGKLE